MAHHNESEPLRSAAREFGLEPYENDQGEIRFAIRADREARRVLLDFGKPVRSIGFTLEQTQHLVDELIARTFELRGIT